MVRETQNESRKYKVRLVPLLNDHLTVMVCDLALRYCKHSLESGVVPVVLVSGSPLG